MEPMPTTYYDSDPEVLAMGPAYARLKFIDRRIETAGSRGAEVLHLAGSGLGLPSGVQVNREGLRAGLERAHERLLASMAEQEGDVSAMPGVTVELPPQLT